MRHHLTLLALSCGSLLGLSACLSTPDRPAVADANPEAAPPSDVSPDTPPASDCPGPRCHRLLAVSVSAYNTGKPGWRIFEWRDEAWHEIETNAPSVIYTELEWRDCCGGPGPDGIPELAITGWTGPKLQSLAIDDQGAVTTSAFADLDASDDDKLVEDLAWGDVAGDTAPDLLVGGGAYHPRILENRGLTWVAGTERLGHNAGVAIGPLDADPELETVYFAAPVDQADTVGGAYLGQADNGYLAGTQVDIGAAQNGIWCDVYGSDRHPDLVVASYGALRVHPSLGGEQNGVYFGDVHDFGATGASRVPLACGDVDGDGWEDLVYGTSFQNEAQLFVVLHDSSGTSPIYTPPTDAFVQGVAVGDLDGDGDGDIFVAQDSLSVSANDQALYVENQSTGAALQFGTAQEIVQAGDAVTDVDFVQFVVPR